MIERTVTATCAPKRTRPPLPDLDVEMNQPTVKDIDQYIAGFSADVQKILCSEDPAKDSPIQNAAPNATEAISYQTRLQDERQGLYSFCRI